MSSAGLIKKRCRPLGQHYRASACLILTGSDKFFDVLGCEKAPQGIDKRFASFGATITKFRDLSTVEKQYARNEKRRCPSGIEE